MAVKAPTGGEAGKNKRALIGLLIVYCSLLFFPPRRAGGKAAEKQTCI
jgi:hypothetical protein